LLLEQENRGQTAALNVALAHATGDFAQFLDADDLIEPEKIERQLVRLKEHPHCVGSSEWGRFYRYPQETRFDPELVWRDLDPIDWLALSRADGLGMMFPAIWLIPMPILRKIGPWMEELTLNNDAEYFTRVLLAAERVLFCPGARCHYRSAVPGSLSGRKSTSAWASQFRVHELCEAYVREREDSDRVRRGFALSWQHLAHASYPYDSGLAERALARARALHPVVIRPDGGPAFAVVSRVVGWRAARRLQVASGRS
jgi:glycosyltransferase involved in cell wall biosynthesis